MTVRAAPAGDLGGIVAVFERSRAAAMPWLPVLHSPDEDLRFFADEIDRSQAWVSLAEGQVTAFAVLRDGWLHHLYVDPPCQGRGIGGELLDRVVAASPGGLQLWVFERNVRAQAFYRVHGFEVVERTDGAGNEEREPDLLMSYTPGAPGF